MPIEFALPDLGENIENGDVVSVLVAVGDTLIEDQTIIELETDKAVIEVPSSISGTVTEILVQQGDTITVGQAIIKVETSAAAAPSAAPAPPPAIETQAEAAIPAPQPAPAAPTPTSAGPIEFALPDLGENIENGDVVNILVAVGDTLAEDQPVIELETDKAVIEVPSSISGTVTEILVQQGDTIAVGQAIIKVETDAATAPSAAPASTAGSQGSTATPAPAPSPGTPPAAPAAATPTAPITASATTTPTKLVPAAPSTRRLAREIGIDITQVKGSGPGGRLSIDDVKAHSKKLHESPSAAPSIAQAAPLPDFSQWGKIDRQPMSKVRQITAQRLVQAWSTIPMVTQFDKTDTTDLEKWRKEYGKKAEAAGGKLTPTAIIIKVLGAALRAFPQFNASIDIASQEIIYKSYCNIGIAVDTPHGLLVPVVRDVDQKNIIELSVELGEMAQKTRDRKVGPADMQGGSITISNVGSMGGTAFTPIVNPPEVAILGVARSSIEPTYVDGELLPRTILPLSLSYDHRLIDGADGARFLRWICAALENPFVVLLEG
ncbi:MAG TPA: dihydrolipoyllysine-residue acetyltransferase [Candidatus Latescibacteria bacterium]|nr:dihydrolipoyllysine-residue acetyltransferase [Candidatus Handelsmanbacteria bacterium]HIL11400.1 dihydrolipoyllysine-residue acetyltransferase [Candidatus Latescibacterota bacterium]